MPCISKNSGWTDGWRWSPAAARRSGFACVDALAEAGARVVIADYNAKIAEEGRDAMKQKGYAVEIALMDVTKPAEVAAVADEIVRRYGQIDILVNNAGIARSETPAETVADEHWLNVIDVNLNGVFWCCRAFGRHMLGGEVAARSSISARCRASSSTSRSRSPTTTPPRRRCIT